MGIDRRGLSALGPWGDAGQERSGWLWYGGIGMAGQSRNVEVGKATQCKDGAAVLAQLGHARLVETRYVKAVEARAACLVAAGIGRQRGAVESRWVWPGRQCRAGQSRSVWPGRRGMAWYCEAVLFRKGGEAS